METYIHPYPQKSEKSPSPATCSTAFLFKKDNQSENYKGLIAIKNRNDGILDGKT